ncbi:MAG: anthranilate synthase component II [Gammaproteobacteria bacterium]
MLLMIDNYDSFTYNIVQYLSELGADVAVYRNDEITLAEIERLAPSRIVVSPGPCTPNEAGISMAVIRTFGPHIPLLGICLGHQSLGQVFGGEVVRARNVMHGKLSAIHHDGSGVFSGLPAPFEATRYHSLVVRRDSLPDCLEMTAWTVLDGSEGLGAAGAVDEIMGLRHREYPIQGVQFHPESIMTQCGHDLLRNFLEDRDDRTARRTGTAG